MKYASLNNSHNKCHSNKYYTDRIFLEKHLFRSIIRSLRPTGRTPRFVLRLGNFYASGTQDIEEKKSPNTDNLTHAHVRPVSVWQLKLLWIAEEKLGNLVIQTINVLLSNVASVQRSPIAWCCKCWVTQLPGIHACGTPPGTTLTEMQ